MNRLLVVLLLSLPFFTACKREYARVQPAKADFFVQNQRIKVNTHVRAPSARLGLESATENEVGESKFTTTDNYPVTNGEVVESEALVNSTTQKLVIGGGKKKGKQVQKRGEETFLAKVFPNERVKETPKKQVNKKKKRITRWNSMIPAGFIFLGIAILLALINLNGLALLFGVASILFLFLGFRKLFRKRRRRSIFR